ncbi:hypothetical protein ECC34666_5042 [Escherichia coli C-34666]|nr:hypothetical protein ECC34666_5042 [Escherichia coli C-34666]EMV88183.1 hypothetical protein EC2865200_3329 [Escherichia coli 2865200]EMX33246.1 hypothetical protein ECMP0215528_5098 [Escherichia coli MP021552.8]ENA08592.1 hypothetical protein ECP02999171_1932 [Escherichia coli P0299917.1]ENC26915.1 hypothetical protein ECP029970676_5073 [Escherichia coli P02997067.6]ENG97482.1 hypothetical protein EC178850_1686 [Escherichia coli 178850]
MTSRSRQAAYSIPEISAVAVGTPVTGSFKPSGLFPPALQK